MFSYRYIKLISDKAHLHVKLDALQLQNQNWGQLFQARALNRGDFFIAWVAVVFVFAIQRLALHEKLERLGHVSFAFDGALQREKIFLALRCVLALLCFRKHPTSGT